MSGEPPLISGFMVVKNVVAQGYPFLEAIVAALPVCDEFLVSEGYSTDETWQALQWLQARYPDKIKLFRDEWHTHGPSGETFAVMQNIVQERCRGEYCLCLQANEILHEASYAELRALPELYPGVEIFNLPFYNMLGGRILWMVDFRKRLFKNRPYIRSVGDGYDVYYLRSRLWHRPFDLLNLNLRSVGVRPYYLPQPIFRYGSLFPKNFVVKLQARREYVSLPALVRRMEATRNDFRTALAEAEANNETITQFWSRARRIYDLRDKGLPPSVNEYHSRSTISETPGSPRWIQHLLDRWEYDLQASYTALADVSPDA